ncbi:MAG: alpha/beta hydrolase [Propioniciclava sp.]
MVRSRWWRRVRRIAVVTLVVGLAFHLVGGWYFSDQIYAGTLERVVRDDAAEDPGTAGLPFEEVAYDAGLGRTPAWLVDGSGDRAGLWVVMVHGRGGVRADWLGQLAALHELGVTTLTIAYRNDPGSPTDPSGEYGFGLTEKADLAAAVDLAVASGAEEVVLMGGSMGGAIVMAHLRDGASPAVVGVILDSPLLDLSAAVDHQAASLGYPVPGSLLWGAKVVTNLRFGLAWSEVDHLRPSDHLTVPALLIHGRADTVVPVTDSRALAADRPDLVTYVETASDHVDSFNDDPVGYAAQLRDFLAPLG